MKSSKMNGLYRLVSFLLIAVLLFCTVGFATGGWQSEADMTPDSGENGDTTNNTDENQDGDTDQTINQDNNNSTDAPENNPPQIIYTSKITGLEITEEEMRRIPIGYVFDSSSSIYGLSSSELTIEFPIEDGSSRLLAYTTCRSLWKIGALAATRNFISNSSNFFGGVVVSYGKDDFVVYSPWETSKIEVDLSIYSSCYYIENRLYVYTNQSKVDQAIEYNASLSGSTYKDAPYDFTSEGETAYGTTTASTVIIPYSFDNETELYYSPGTNKYIYFKSGERKVDMLNGSNISYTNVFVLFADTTTYEKADGCELVFDTVGGGRGYYISYGYKTEINWCSDPEGNLSFTTLDGKRLVVNRGNVYISYYKSSVSDEVTFD